MCACMLLQFLMFHKLLNLFNFFLLVSGKILRLSRDHGISPKGFLTEGRPIWSPFLTFFKKLFNYFQIFNFLRSWAGWSLVHSGSRVLLVTIRALSTLSILLTISLFMISIFLLSNLPISILYFLIGHMLN